MIIEDTIQKILNKNDITKQWPSVRCWKVSNIKKPFSCDVDLEKRVTNNVLDILIQIDEEIKKADATECLTSIVPYIREAKKYFMEK